MTTVEKSIELNVPVSTAYNQWTQFQSFPNFMEGVESVQQLDDTHLHWKANINGNVQEWDAEITEQIPDERIAWTSVNGAPNGGVVTFHHLSPDTCRVMLQLEYEPSGMMENIGNMLGVVEHQIESDLNRFRDFIERQGVETGAWRGTVDQHSGEVAGSESSGTASYSSGLNPGSNQYPDAQAGTVPAEEMSPSAAGATYNRNVGDNSDYATSGTDTSQGTGGINRANQYDEQTTGPASTETAQSQTDFSRGIAPSPNREADQETRGEQEKPTEPALSGNPPDDPV